MNLPEIEMYSPGATERKKPSTLAGSVIGKKSIGDACTFRDPNGGCKFGLLFLESAENENANDGRRSRAFG